MHIPERQFLATVSIVKAPDRIQKSLETDTLAVGKSQALLLHSAYYSILSITVLYVNSSNPVSLMAETCLFISGP